MWIHYIMELYKEEKIDIERAKLMARYVDPVSGMILPKGGTQIL